MNENVRAKRVLRAAQEAERLRRKGEHRGWGPAMGLPEIELADNPVYRMRTSWKDVDFSEVYAPRRTYRAASERPAPAKNPFRGAVVD